MFYGMLKHQNRCRPGISVPPGPVEKRHIGRGVGTRFEQEANQIGAGKHGRAVQRPQDLTMIAIGVGVDIGTQCDEKCGHVKMALAYGRMEQRFAGR